MVVGGSAAHACGVGGSQVGTWFYYRRLRLSLYPEWETKPRMIRVQGIGYPIELRAPSLAGMAKQGFTSLGKAHVFARQ